MVKLCERQLAVSGNALDHAAIRVDPCREGTIIAVWKMNLLLLSASSLVGCGGGGGGSRY